MSPDEPDDLPDALDDDGLAALPAGAVAALRRAAVHTAWCAEPTIHLRYDELTDVLVARVVHLPALRERHVHDHLLVRLDAADDLALLVELRLSGFSAAQRSPASVKARELLGPTAWRRAVELTVAGAVETAVRLDADERDVLLARWAGFARPVTALGVQVLPEALHGVLVDERGGIVAESTVELARPHPDAVVAGVTDMLAGLPRPVEAVCLQIGAPVAPSGEVHQYDKGGANTDDWRGVHLAPMIAEETGLPIHLVNDAVALATRERWLGLGSDPERYGVLLVAEGIGGALVRGGTPDPDTPMELGNFVIHPTGRKCRCGNRGCVEATAGTWAIVERIRDELGHDDVFDLADAVAHAEESSDPFVRAVFREAGEDLAIGIAAVQVLLALKAWVVVLPPELHGDGVAGAAFRFGMEQFAYWVSYEPYRKIELHLQVSSVRDGAQGAALVALEQFGLSDRTAARDRPPAQ